MNIKINRRDFIKDVMIGTALLPFIGNLSAAKKTNTLTLGQDITTNQKSIKLITDAMPDKPSVKPLKKHKVLIYSFTLGFYHPSIPVGNKCFEIMGQKTGAFEAVVSNDPLNFTAENLKQFDCIILNNITGEFLSVDEELKPENNPNLSKKENEHNLKQYKKHIGRHKKTLKKFPEFSERINSILGGTQTLRKNLMDWVKSGKAIVGIHGAADVGYDWKEYGEMLGGRFSKHPWSAKSKVFIKVDKPENPINSYFNGETFSVTDEIYQFTAGFYSREKQNILLSLDMTKTKGRGQRKDNDYAISWTKNHGKGRVFYCGLGHNNHIFWDPKVVSHYLAGIQWALGDI